MKQMHNELPRGKTTDGHDKKTNKLRLVLQRGEVVPLVPLSSFCEEECAEQSKSVVTKSSDVTPREWRLNWSKISMKKCRRVTNRRIIGYTRV